jgi:urease accessory protein
MDIRFRPSDVIGDAAAEPATTDESIEASHWRARLELRYRYDQRRSYLAKRAHSGPLVVQKSLYPEGDRVCQSIILHPPGGIAGGDSLSIDVVVEPDAHVQFITPGAAKWYRSSGGAARQVVSLDIGDGGVVEWLPQESIVFNGAIAQTETTIRLAPTAIYVGWDVVCLGRTASSERFVAGRLTQGLSVRRAEALLYAERIALAGGGGDLDSPVALNAAPVFGTLLAIAPTISDAMLTSSREVAAREGDLAVTRLPGLMVARYRGASCEAARACFTSLWTRLRPLLFARDAVVPRLWST